MYKTKMRLGVRLVNFLRLLLRLEVFLLQAKGVCSGSDILFPSTLLRLGLGNKSEARPSVCIIRMFLDFFFIGIISTPQKMSILYVGFLFTAHCIVNLLYSVNLQISIDVQCSSSEVI